MCNMLNLLNSKDETKMNSLKMHYVDSTKKNTDLSTEYNDSMAAINAQYDYDDPQRERALQEVKDEFEFLKAQNAAYIDEVETEMNDLKTRIDQRTTYRETLQEQISQEVEKDHNYGPGRGHK